MPFQESADSLKAKAHISKVKTPAVIGIAALALVALLAVSFGLWSSFASSSFEILKQDPPGSVPASDGGDGAAPGQEGAAPRTITVHIGGAVASPGVYVLAEGSRVQGAVDAAGGFTDEADRDSNNLARVLKDGEQVIVAAQGPANAAAEGPDGPQGQARPAGKVNINTAGAAELEALPGIGAATAKKIVADRETKGPFLAVEELKRVSGIGEKKYADLADLICV